MPRMWPTGPRAEVREHMTVRRETVTGPSMVDAAIVPTLVLVFGVAVTVWLNLALVP